MLFRSRAVSAFSGALLQFSVFHSHGRKTLIRVITAAVNAHFILFVSIFLPSFVKTSLNLCKIHFKRYHFHFCVSIPHFITFKYTGRRPFRQKNGSHLSLCFFFIHVILGDRIKAQISLRIFNRKGALSHESGRKIIKIRYHQNPQRRAQ